MLPAREGRGLKRRVIQGYPTPWVSPESPHFPMLVPRSTFHWHCVQAGSVEGVDMSASIEPTQGFPILSGRLGPLEGGERRGLGKLCMSCLLSKECSQSFLTSAGFLRIPSHFLQTLGSPFFMVSSHGPSAIEDLAQQTTVCLYPVAGALWTGRSALPLLLESIFYSFRSRANLGGEFIEASTLHFK